MFLSDTSIRRPVLAVMMTVALVIFGGVGLGRLPVRDFPKVDFPTVSITVIYPGASPEVVEKDVVDILEEQVNTIEGIRFINSNSGEGGALIQLQFEYERDIDIATQEVRDKVASVRNFLPDSIEEPLIQKFDVDSFEIMWMALTATDRDVVELTEYADKFIKPQIENLKGVGQVHFGGGQEFAVRIWIDPELLGARGLTVGDVARALRSQNAEIPSGRIEGFQREFTVRTEGDLKTVADFESLFIAYHDGSPVYLRDIGRAVPGPRETRSRARFSRLPDAIGRETVGLGIRKQTDANTVNVADRIKEKLGSIRAELPPAFELTIAYDGSLPVQQSIDELMEALVLGALLTVVVIFVFLVSGRSTIIAALSIPTSIIATFAVIHFLGFTINNFTMLALVLAVGIVIDDAVVVLENIYRHAEMKKSVFQAAMEGASEIAFAAMAATFAIAAVFLPLAFVTGMVGRLFLEFAVTVAAAVLVSLFVALTLIPMLCSRFLRVRKEKGSFGESINEIFDGVLRVYRATLKTGLEVRGLVVLLAFVLMALVVSLFREIPREFQPEVDQGAFFMMIKGPQGATLDYTDRYLREVEDILAQTPEIESYFAAIGLAMMGVPKVNEAVSFVRMKDLEDRQAAGLRGQVEVIADLRQKLADIPGFQATPMSFTTISSTGSFAPVAFVIMGPDIGELYDVSEEIKRRLSDTDGIADVTTNFDLNKPKLEVLPNREKAADLGVEITEIAETLRILLGGTDITQFKRGGERYDVMVQLDAGSRRIPENIAGIHVRTRTGALVPLSAVVDVQETVGPSEILRYNRSRSVTLEAYVEGDLKAGRANEIAQEVAAEVMPPSFRTVLTGQSKDMQESFASLAFTFILAVLMIYMLLASQFNHFVHPFTIMLALPLALFGALGGLWLMGLTLNLFSIIGIIMLMGLVTKNSILLVDYTNQMREKEGMERNEAVLKAGMVRLRPILMTAFSTVLAVLPALVGVGAGLENRQPLAAAVVFGMLTSTFLTLIVVPVVYTLLDDAGRILTGSRRKDSPAAAASTPGPDVASDGESCSP